MSKALRVAIVGAGRMGKIHAASCRAIGDEVRIVCDPDRERAEALAKGLPTASIVEDTSAIDWSAIDAAFFCTPPFARGPAECAAAAANVALFIEKPIALSSAAAEELAAVVERHQTMTSVGYMNRYRDSVRRAKQLCDQHGVLGLACHWVGNVYRVPWWGKREMSGGQLNEQCTHFIDLIRMFCGEVVEVAAMSKPSTADAEIEVDESAAAMFRTRDGILATLFASCAAEVKQIDLQVFTPTRGVCLDGWDLVLRNEERVEDNDPFVTEAEVFLNAVRSSDPTAILSTLADAVKTQRVTDALMTATTSGGWVEVV